MAEAAEFPLLKIDQAIKIVEKTEKIKLHSGGFAAFLDQFLQNKPDDYDFSVEEAKKLLGVIDNLAPVPAISTAVDAAPPENDSELTKKFNALLALTGNPEAVADVNIGGKRTVFYDTPLAEITLAQSSGAGLDSLRVKLTTDDTQKVAAITAAVEDIKQLFNKEAAAVVTPFALPTVTVQNLEPVQAFVRAEGGDNLKNILNNLSQPLVRNMSSFMNENQSLVSYSMGQIREKLQELKSLGLLDNEQTLLATGLLTTDIPPEQTTAKPGFRIFGVGF